MAAISDMIWLIALNAGLTFGLALSYVPQPPLLRPPVVLIALGVAFTVALWCGLGVRVQRRGGSSRDVWSAVWRVLLLNLLIAMLSQIIAAMARPGSFDMLSALGNVLMLPIGFVLVLVLVLAIVFVLAAIPTDLLAQFGYALAKAVWGTPNAG
jgi:hypothetical protein